MPVVEEAADDAAEPATELESATASSSKVPGFLLWLGFVWVGLPALLAGLGVQVPEHL